LLLAVVVVVVTLAVEVVGAEVRVDFVLQQVFLFLLVLQLL
jgi:hypothetical protein